MSFVGAIVSLLIAAAAWAPSEAPVADPIATARYNVGAAVEMRFAYSGDIEDWDAHFCFDNKANPPLVKLGARAVFILSKGAGPFESRCGRARIHCELWELMEAPRGKVVVPKNKEFGRIAAYNAIINTPFDEIVDLTTFFELEEPGLYTLLWGCRPSYLEEIVFEIIP